MNFNNFIFYDHATFKNLALTIGFGHFSVLAWILLHVDDRLRLSYFMWCQLLHVFPMKYQHFHVDIFRLHLRQSHRSRTARLNAEAFKCARGRKVSLCVTFFAPSLGSMFRLISGCSKYVTFSITFGALVLQTTVCVAFGARRRVAWMVRHQLDQLRRSVWHGLIGPLPHLFAWICIMIRYTLRWLDPN